MHISSNDEESTPTAAEDYYEARASQEEIYREESEDEVREVLETAEQTPAENNSDCKAESLDEQLNHEVEELITGDADDPPLSEEAIGEMLITDCDLGAA